MAETQGVADFKRKAFKFKRFSHKRLDRSNVAERFGDDPIRGLVVVVVVVVVVISSII